MRHAVIAMTMVGLALPALAGAQSQPMPSGSAPTIALALQSSSGGQRSRRDMRDDFHGCTDRPEVIPRANSARIAACDRALGDATDDAPVWHRRAVLLHNKAVWQFASGLNDDAFATLDQSDAAAAAAGEPTLVFDGSTGIGNTMLRALLLDRRNQRIDALALLEQARAVRPYSMTIQTAIDRYEMAITRDIDRLRPLTVRHLSTDPMAARTLFYQQFFAGELAQADATAELIRFGRPALIGGWTIEGKDPVLEDLQAEVELLYMRAYIRAALGDAAGSDAMFVRLEQRLAAYIGPQPVPTPQRRIVRSEVMQAWQARVLRADELRQPAAHWRAAIDMRAEVAGGAGPEVFEKPRFRRVRELAVAPDILRAAADANLQQRAEILTMLRTEQQSALRESIELTDDQAIRILPEAESLSTYPRFGRAGDGIMIGREAGYSQAPQRDGDVRTIRFGTLSGSGATADELVILAAATYAQREELDSFLIVGRHLLKRSTNITGYFGGTSVADSGSEGAVLAVLIDSDAVPPQWEAHRSRMIRVADVMSTLGARQTAIEAAKAAQQARR